jgi:hypothetical protein
LHTPSVHLYTRCTCRVHIIHNTIHDVHIIHNYTVAVFPARFVTHTAFHVLTLLFRALPQMFRAQKVESGEWEARPAGCHGLSLLVKHLPYVDYNRVHKVPVAHALLLGVVKDFWKLLLSPTPKGQAKPHYVLPPQSKKHMAARANSVIMTCDFGRPYRCVVLQRGNWVMENWIAWIEVHSVFITQDFQKVRIHPCLIYTYALHIVYTYHIRAARVAHRHYICTSLCIFDIYIIHTINTGATHYTYRLHVTCTLYNILCCPYNGNAYHKTYTTSLRPT